MKTLTLLKKTMLQLTFLIGILLLASCDYNQNSEDSKDVAEEQNDEKFDNNKQEKDAQFLVDAAEIHLEQIHLAQLAQQNGNSTHAKELGKKIEDAHTKLLNDLTALANSKSVTIPTSATNDAQDAYEKLNKKSGEDFDKAYADMMVDEHKDALELFEDASEDCNDTEIRNWASTTLSDLHTSLDHSVECQKKCDKTYSKK